MYLKHVQSWYTDSNMCICLHWVLFQDCVYCAITHSFYGFQYCSHNSVFLNSVAVTRFTPTVSESPWQHGFEPRWWRMTDYFFDCLLNQNTSRNEDQKYLIHSTFYNFINSDFIELLKNGIKTITTTTTMTVMKTMTAMIKVVLYLHYDYSFNVNTYVKHTLKESYLYLIRL